VFKAHGPLFTPPPYTAYDVVKPLVPEPPERVHLLQIYISDHPLSSDIILNPPFCWSPPCRSWSHHVPTRRGSSIQGPKWAPPLLLTPRVFLHARLSLLSRTVQIEVSSHWLSIYKRQPFPTLTGLPFFPTFTCLLGFCYCLARLFPFQGDCTLPSSLPMAKTMCPPHREFDVVVSSNDTLSVQICLH